MTKRDIVSLIDQAAARFGRDALAGGNCGTFALALARRLQNDERKATLAFIYKDVAGTETVADVIVAETDIYHVVVECDGKIYDGMGETTLDALHAIALDQYADPDAAILLGISSDDPDMLQLISSETNHDISAALFATAW